MSLSSMSLAAPIFPVMMPIALALVLKGVALETIPSAARCETTE